VRLFATEESAMNSRRPSTILLASIVLAAALVVETPAPPPAPLTVVAHDASLAGTGRADAPLAITAGGVGASHIAAGAVGTNQIAPGAITTAKLASATPSAAGQVLTYTGTAMSWQTPAVPVALVHTVTDANLCVPTGDKVTGGVTVVDHPAANGDPNAILIVTPNTGNDRWDVPFSPVGVAYDDGTGDLQFACTPDSLGRWVIHSNAPLTAEMAFNVLVFKQ
jgi:hypothetical protein